MNPEQLIRRYAPERLELIEQYNCLIKDEPEEMQWYAYSLLVEQILPSYEFDVITVDSQGKEIERKKGKAHYFTEDLGDGVGLDMVYIPGGEAVIGAEKVHKDEIEVWRNHEQTNPYGEREYSSFILEPSIPCKVKANPFFMSKYPITVEQWDMVAKKSQQRSFWIAQQRCLKCLKGNKLDPMSLVERRQIIDFCEYLSQKAEILFRIPSLLEWAYACRAGTRTPYHFGDTITTELANFNNDRKTPVGSFPPNRFGLHDMHGNVYEWCGGWEYCQMGIYPDVINSENSLVNLDCEVHNLVEIEGFLRDFRRKTDFTKVRLRGGGYSSRRRDCLTYVSRTFTNSYEKDVGFRLICS